MRQHIFRQENFDARRDGNCEQQTEEAADGDEDCVHIVIVSRQFDDLSYQEKEALLWEELTKHVSEDDQRHVTLLVGVSPEEVKAY